MPWAKLDDNLPERLGLMGLSIPARWLYIEGLAYCARNLTDGVITRALAKLSDTDDPEACAEELVDSGAWERLPQGFRIAGYLDDQRSAAIVERDRAENRAKQARRYRHSKGDHSQCIRGRVCPDGALEPKPTNRVSNLVSNRPPIQSDPIRSEIRIGEEGIAAPERSALTRSTLSTPLSLEGMADSLARSLPSGWRLERKGFVHDEQYVDVIAWRDGIAATFTASVDDGISLLALRLAVPLTMYPDLSVIEHDGKAWDDLYQTIEARLRSVRSEIYLRDVEALWIDEGCALLAFESGDRDFSTLVEHAMTALTLVMDCL